MSLQFTNLMAMARKPYYVTANVFTSGYDLSWIPSVNQLTIDDAQESPDDSRTTFTFASAPRYVVLNGLIQIEDDGYTRSNNIITLPVAPATGESVKAIL